MLEGNPATNTSSPISGIASSDNWSLDVGNLGSDINTAMSHEGSSVLRLLTGKRGCSIGCVNFAVIELE